MSDSSAIEWTDATWNPVTGCTKVSQGCKNCYAERDWTRLSANPKSVYYLRKFTDVAVHPERLDAPLRWTKPRRIFVNSMSDLFHEDVPGDFIDALLDVIKRCGHLGRGHVFQVLTKRADRMLRFMRHYKPIDNLWLGVSVEDQASADERIPLLLQTPAAVRWISAEPLLGPISFEGRWVEYESPAIHENWLERLNWVVAGGESGPAARPSHPDWFRSLRDQCGAVGTAFFFKQWGEWVSVSEVGAKGAHHHFDDGATVRRAGKHVAGRRLDGRTHDEYPA